MAIGSAIIFLPIQIGLKGIWVFFAALLISYPAVYLIQKIFLQTLSGTPSCQSYSDVIDQHLSPNWGFLLGLLYCLNMFKSILQYSMSVTYDSAFYIYSFGLTDVLLSDNLWYGLIILVTLTFIAMHGEMLLFKVSGPMIIVKFFLIVSLGLLMYSHWSFANIPDFPGARKFIIDVILTLPFALFSIDFFPSLSPMNVAFRKKESDASIAKYRVLRVNKVAYCILVLAVFTFALSFTLSLSYDEAVEAWTKNISVLAIAAKAFSGDTIKYISITLNIFAMVTAFLGVYLAFHEGIKGIVFNVIRRMGFRPEYYEKSISLAISLFIVLLLWGWVNTHISILLLSQLGAPIYAVLACFIPAYLISRVDVLKSLMSWKVYYIVGIGIMLCLTPVVKFMFD
ncbi:TPA: transporter [Yersinia enterocolitica]|uniref:transporter n=1 Tax=Yersinia enterocolitica TaxID=630 RepID=UPI001E64BF57|nr:transporter [Yersinia enterocolitica]